MRYPAKDIGKILLCILLPVLLIISGCGSQLSEEQYIEELQNNFREFGSSVTRFSTTLSDGEKDGNFDTAVIAECCEKIKSALNRIEALNPPAGYSENHGRIGTGIDQEREYVKCAEKINDYLKSNSPVDTGSAEYQRLVDDLSAKAQASTFVDAVVQTVIQSKNKE